MGCSIGTAQGWGENWREGLAKQISDAQASVSLAAQGETSSPEASPSLMSATMPFIAMKTQQFM